VPFVNPSLAASFLLGCLCGGGLVYFVVLKPIMKMLLVVPISPITSRDVQNWKYRLEEASQLRKTAREAFDKLGPNGG
jgi:hypothetical protein